MRQLKKISLVFFIVIMQFPKIAVAQDSKEIRLMNSDIPILGEKVLNWLPYLGIAIIVVAVGYIIYQKRKTKNNPPMNKKNPRNSSHTSGKSTNSRKGKNRKK